VGRDFHREQSLRLVSFIDAEPGETMLIPFAGRQGKGWRFFGTELPKVGLRIGGIGR